MLKRLLLTVLVVCFFFVAPVAATEETVDGIRTTEVAGIVGVSTVAATEAGTLTASAASVVHSAVAAKEYATVEAMLQLTVYRDPMYLTLKDASQITYNAKYIATENMHELVTACQEINVVIGGIVAAIVLVGSVSLVVYSVATEDPKIFEGLEQTYSWGFDYP